ncbi:MAG: FAD-binding oxidoreductase [Planctomycetota bacterium]
MQLSARIEELVGERVGKLGHWGGPEVPIASPRGESELAAVLGVARDEGLRVLPIGNGSKLDWALVPERVDLALSTRRMRGVVEYEPAEGVMTARAGTPLRELRLLAAQNGHHLSPEVPGDARATLGGAVSAAQSGPDRLRYGPIRDQVLGVRLALVDGRVVRSGGALVKDVAGYDLHRLVCGAHGTLGVVTEVSLRLHTLQPVRALVRHAVGDVTDGVAAAFAAFDRVPRARAVRLDGTDGRWWLSLDLEGRAEVVEDELERVLALLGRVNVLRDESARRTCEELCEARRRGGDWPLFAIRTRPSRLTEALAAVAPFVDVGRSRAELHPLVGEAFVFAEVPEERLDAIDRAVRSSGASIRWLGAPPSVRAALARSPEGAELARRLREALDPTHVLAGPRIHEGL